MSPASLALQRVIDAIPHKSHALVMSPRVSQSTGPCSHSIQTESNPSGPRKSIISLDNNPEMHVAGSPRRSLSFTGFGRIAGTVALLLIGVAAV
jgi:hypothetical protein